MFIDNKVITSEQPVINRHTSVFPCNNGEDEDYDRQYE